MHKHATDYTKPLLADFERNSAVLESLKTPNILEGFERNSAVLESLKTPNILADFKPNNAVLESLKIPNILEGFERNSAVLESLKTPNILEGFERNSAVLESLKTPNILADFKPNNAVLESLKIPNILEGFEQNNAAFEETKEHKANYVETDYNHDLAHRSTEESNHAIEDNNKVITSVAPNQHQITEAPTSLREKEKASQDISSQRQIEIIERLELLSEQVKLAPSERKAGRIKSTLLVLFGALSAANNLPKIWSQWGDAIKNFFRMFFGILAEIWSQWGDAIKNFFGLHE